MHNVCMDTRIKQHARRWLITKRVLKTRRRKKKKKAGLHKVLLTWPVIVSYSKHLGQHLEHTACMASRDLPKIAEYKQEV